MELGELPAGWLASSLGELADWGSGGTPSRSEPRFFQGNIPWIKTGELGDKYIRDAGERITEEAIQRSSAKIFPKGAVGIAMYGATIGKLSIWGIDASTNQACAVGVVSEALNNEFLYYFLLSERRNLTKAGKGGAQPNISQGIIKDWPIKLPPLAEQHRIVAKLEELFSELDQGVASLRTAREQLKVYRQSLLKNAFEGKLTAAWRAAHCDQLETAAALQQRIACERQARYLQQLADWQAAGQAGPKPKPPKPLPPLTAEELAELPELPAGWGWVRPEEIASQERYSIGIGPFGSCLKVSDYRESGVPLIFVKNITRFNFSTDLKYIDQEKFKELSAHSVQALDLLITKMGDPPGDCEIYPEGSPTAVLTADCLKFRLWDKFANRLLYKHCINSNFVKRQLGLITRGVAQKKISVERFKTIALPLMSVEEQKVLVEELESKLSEADQLDQTLATALQQADALRQSILKKAFHGQLVKQAKNEEPATALLERIRAARCSNQPARRGRSAGSQS
jgi:type I restriction enzyme S subunit